MRTRGESNRGRTDSLYEQFDISPDVIEQILRHVVCEQRQTDLMSHILDGESGYRVERMEGARRRGAPTTSNGIGMQTINRHCVDIRNVLGPTRKQSMSKPTITCLYSLTWPIM